MNCQDALDLLYEIIDKEASEINANQVKEHLDKCRHCFEVYRLEGSIQEFINEKVKPSSSSANVENLKSKILNQLDKIDIQDSSKEPPRFFNITTKALVAAASLVLLIGAGFLVSNFYQHYSFYIPLEKAHWAVANDMDAYQNGEVTTELISFMQQQYHYHLSDEVLDFSLLGGHTEEIMGVEMSHFVYTSEDKVVSVFVANSDKFEIPSDLNDSRYEKNPITFFDHNCRGCRLVYHKIGSAVIITATTNRSVDLLNFVPGISAI